MSTLQKQREDLLRLIYTYWCRLQSIENDHRERSEPTRPTNSNQTPNATYLSPRYSSYPNGPSISHTMGQRNRTVGSARNSMLLQPRDHQLNGVEVRNDSLSHDGPLTSGIFRESDNVDRRENEELILITEEEGPRYTTPNDMLIQLSSGGGLRHRARDNDKQN